LALWLLCQHSDNKELNSIILLKRYVKKEWLNTQTNSRFQAHITIHQSFFNFIYRSNNLLPSKLTKYCPDFLFQIYLFSESDLFCVNQQLQWWVQTFMERLLTRISWGISTSNVHRPTLVISDIEFSLNPNFLSELLPVWQPFVSRSFV
jgi:hypothetical protein